MEKEINRLEGEKSKVQSRCRALENELRITREQVEELLSTNLDNENVIRMKVRNSIQTLILGLANCAIARKHSSKDCPGIEY